MYHIIRHRLNRSFVLVSPSRTLPIYHSPEQKPVENICLEWIQLKIKPICHIWAHTQTPAAINIEYFRTNRIGQSGEHKMLITNTHSKTVMRVCAMAARRIVCNQTGNPSQKHSHSNIHSLKDRAAVSVCCLHFLLLSSPLILWQRKPS